MSAYENTINELEKQVNDFSKYIKPEDINPVDTGISKHKDDVSFSVNSKMNYSNLKYIAIPVSIFGLLILIKPKFIVIEKEVDDKKIKKISYIRVIIITLIVSLVIYLILKNKNSLLNKK
jgi:hypothetical protein